LTNKITGRSKGCAFVEFEDASHHEKALKYDQQKLKGRKINVEPTAGGGGKVTGISKRVSACTYSCCAAVDQTKGETATS
jgi:RNA recognition motif-containing protein